MYICRLRGLKALNAPQDLKLSDIHTNWQISTSCMRSGSGTALDHCKEQEAGVKGLYLISS